MPNNTGTSNTAQFGTFGIQSTATNNGFLQDNGYWNGTNEIYRQNGAIAMFQFGVPGAGDISFRSAPSGTAGNTATLTTNVVVKQNGNVGIGTTNPSTMLQINSSGTPRGLRLSGLTSGSTNYQEIQMAGDGNEYRFGVGGSSETVYGVANKFYLFDLNAGAMRMVLDSNGRVGIGTTAPDASLTVGISTSASGLYPSTAGISLRASNSTTTKKTGLYLSNADDLSIYTLDNLGIHQKWNGNVGIGVTNPNAKLTIANNVSSDGPGGNYANYQLMLYDGGTANSSYGLGISGSTLWFNSAAVFKFHANGTQVGWVDASGFRNGSDLRLKKDIRPLESSLQRMLLLDGVSYSWINDNFPKKRVMGFIAQDLAKVFPEVVDAEDNGYLSVNYSQLIAPLVEALKEEHEHNQNLQNKVEKLQNKLDLLTKILCEKDRIEEFCQK